MAPSAPAGWRSARRSSYDPRVNRPLLALLLAAIAAPAFASGLTLQPTRSLDMDLHEGTWMQPDISPDGRTILFDLLGDIYALDSAGGTARPVLTGMAYEHHPVFSPDGRHFAFVSDRSGTTNLWIADADERNPRMLSAETSLNVMTSPCWAPDGRSVYVSRMVHAVLAFELWRYGLDGGSGIRITKAQPNGDDDWDKRQNALGAAPAPDGRTIYYSAKTGHTWTLKDLPNWQIARRDLRTGETTTVIASSGAAMRPALSHDGRLLAYASRWRQQTGLRLRDLTTGADRWLAFPIDPDGQDQGYYYDLTPRYAFMPGDKALILSIGGKLARLDVASGKVTDIPFAAPVHLSLGSLTRVTQTDETGPVRARIIQAPRQSPDGRRLAFAALGRLWVQDLVPGAAPHPLRGAPDWAYQPAWSPDGRRIAFVTWTAQDGGSLWSIPGTGGAPRRLSDAPAFYTEPVWSPDGRTIAVLRANHFDRLHASSEIAVDRPTEIVTIPAEGGPTRFVAATTGGRALAFVGDRLRVYDPEGVKSVRLDGSDPRRELVVVAQSPSQYVGGPVPVDEVRLDPSGTHALVKAASELILIDVPPANGAAPPVVDIDAPSLRRIRLTRLGADFFDWADGSRAITWSLGSDYRRIATAAASADAEARAERFVAPATLPRDRPEGAIVLRGGTAITMRGDEVIADADVLIDRDRIAAVGAKGSVPIPAGAAIRDVSGKFLIPGFVDVHAHYFAQKKVIQDATAADYLATLAYGVTSSLDPQAFTIDAFVYQDLIEAGRMIGPRAWSVGPGIFRESRIETKADAIDVLTRYRNAYRTRNVKSYMVGDRQERQAMVAGAAALGMMPTTEGASDFVLDLTHAIDGFSGNEHALPITPLHADIVQLFARSRTSYTPTLSILYGGRGAIDAAVIGERIEDEAKFRRFTPESIIADKLRERRWLPPGQQSYARFAADALAIQRAGGLVGIGSHGEVQGIGYQWELAAYAAGGATPREVLTAATIGGAEVIGHQADVGSLAPGKYADLLILEADPLADSINLRRIAQVMKNGRLYDAATLDEIWPRSRPLPRLWFQDEAPATMQGTR